MGDLILQRMAIKVLVQNRKEVRWVAGTHNAFAASWGFGAFVIGRIVFVFLANERRKEGRKEETRNRKKKTTRRREKKMERRGETKKERYRKAKEDRESSRKGKNKG